MISTGDINVFTDAPATDTFGEIGALMNKMMEYPDGSRDTAYCIELGVEVNYPEDYENVEDLIPDPQHLRLVGDALTFGFKAEDGRIDSAEENARYAATQILIWEILEGGFGSPQAAKDVLTCLEYTADPAEAKSFYRSLVEAVESKYVLPSFAAENAESAVPIELKWDETKYSAAVTDSNGALSRYRWSGDGLTFDQSGNTLTISADAPLSETIRLRANCETEGGPGAVICWQNKDPSRQNIATGWNASDTVSAYIAVSCESAGYLKIVKTSEDGQVSEIPFHISGNGIDRDVVTGPDGIIEVDGLQAGTYTVTEQTPDKYVQPASQQVEVFPGRVSSVSFSNILKKFTVEVKKVDAATGEAQGEASLDGAVYGLYKGETLLDTYTTENGGRFTTKMYPCGTDFSLREITPSEGYLLDKTVYPVGAEPGNFTLENNSIPITVTEDVVLGASPSPNTQTGLQTMGTPIRLSNRKKARNSRSISQAPAAMRTPENPNGISFAQIPTVSHGPKISRTACMWCISPRARTDRNPSRTSRCSSPSTSRPTIISSTTPLLPPSSELKSGMLKVERSFRLQAPHSKSAIPIPVNG